MGKEKNKTVDREDKKYLDADFLKMKFNASVAREAKDASVERKKTAMVMAGLTKRIKIVVEMQPRHSDAEAKQRNLRASCAG